MNRNGGCWRQRHLPSMKYIVIDGISFTRRHKCDRNNFFISRECGSVTFQSWKLNKQNRIQQRSDAGQSRAYTVNPDIQRQQRSDAGQSHTYTVNPDRQQFKQLFISDFLTTIFRIVEFIIVFFFCWDFVFVVVANLAVAISLSFTD